MFWHVCTYEKFAKHTTSYTYIKLKLQINNIIFSVKNVNFNEMDRQQIHHLQWFLNLQLCRFMAFYIIQSNEDINRNYVTDIYDKKCIVGMLI